jgi:hypothetical protein
VLAGTLLELKAVHSPPGCRSDDDVGQVVQWLWWRQVAQSYEDHQTNVHGHRGGDGGDRCGGDWQTVQWR